MRSCSRSPIPHRTFGVCIERGVGAHNRLVSHITRCHRILVSMVGLFVASVERLYPPSLNADLISPAFALPHPLITETVQLAPFILPFIRLCTRSNPPMSAMHAL